MTQQNDQNEPLDRLLSALGTAEPDTGFTRRLSERVEAVRRHEKRAGLPWLAWAPGFACACGLALLMSFALHHRNEAPVVKTDVASADRIPRLTATPSTSRDQAKQPVHSKRLVSTRSSGARGSRSPRSLDASKLASFLAPPLPLTEQEKLLAGIARQGDEQEMAMLSPDIRARVDARQQAAFHQVFEQGIPQFRNQPITEERGDE